MGRGAPRGGGARNVFHAERERCCRQEFTLVCLFIFSVWVDFCLGYKRGLKRRSFSYSVTVGIIYNLAFIENVYFNIRFDTLKWVCTRVRVPA